MTSIRIGNTIIPVANRVIRLDGKEIHIGECSVEFENEQYASQAFEELAKDCCEFDDDDCALINAECNCKLRKE